ncbi:Hypothetical protein R9X50_00726700 [Acrodontium crateriforme]|uniref:Uncharacterized protein n=1 Tax=Acrodontium crateriforme TaxID=150365 RepID=A0AAQ3MCR7_9PEZI|nr:Hypothetical protein R9X50_00726700 [Acrodontium crateriforme]
MKILFPISLVADLAANVLAGPIVPSTNELKRQVISYRCTYPNSVPAATFRVAYVNSQIAVATIGGFDAGASGYLNAKRYPITYTLLLLNFIFDLAEQKMDDILPYRIVEDCSAHGLGDENDVLQYQAAILECAMGHSRPDATASALTKIVAERAWQHKAAVDMAQQGDSYIVESDLITAVIGSAASSFPPSHAAQTRLIDIFEALPLVLPRQEVPNPVLNSDGTVRSGHQGSEHLIDTRPQRILWENLNLLHFDTNFSWLAESGQTKWSGVEKCGSEEQWRWRNLSHFMAKVTVRGMKDLSRFSALFMIFPHQLIAFDTPGWSGYLAGQALAAAQWIIPDQHAAFVWKECQSMPSTGNVSPPGRRRWSLESWSRWKQIFQQVADMVDDTRVHETARRDSLRASEIMSEVESHEHDRNV